MPLPSRRSPCSFLQIQLNSYLFRDTHQILPLKSVSLPIGPSSLNTRYKRPKSVSYYEHAVMPVVYLSTWVAASVSKEGRGEQREGGRKGGARNESEEKPPGSPLVHLPGLNKTAPRCLLGLATRIGFSSWTCRPHPWLADPSPPLPLLLPSPCASILDAQQLHPILSSSISEKGTRRNWRETGQRDENRMLKTAC